MIYTPLIHRAIRFSIKTHEVYQKQKRKGKDIPYITHPLSVGLILARAGADEALIAAGILHDTIEDSTLGKKVTREMLTERFGEAVATLVASVTEFNKDQSWEIRKREAIEHIHTFSHDSLLLKSADIISNTSELLDDHAEFGNAVFDRFNAPQEKILKNYLETITVIITRWPDSPLAGDLRGIAESLYGIGQWYFMRNYHAILMEYSEYDESAVIECPVCAWKGTPKSSEMIEYYDDLLDVSCPICSKMILVVSYPLVSKMA
ncbi:HD domain-containing protein [Candidatus Woesebacteria bacterium]|nr:HD domain-containing protein [Candidatus Woesebacteria bacterium]